MAYQYELVLFDLDGTLTDSGLGIMNSVQYALKKIGRGVENLEELKCFVGPPLAQQFAKFCGFSDEKGHQMVEFYREGAQRHTGTGDCPGPGNHQSGEAGTSHAFGAYGKDEL